MSQSDPSTEAGDSPDRDDEVTDDERAETPGREYDVPDDVTGFECPYCVAVIPRQDLLELHIGHEHGDTATDEECDTFEKTFDRESNDVFIYHLKVISLVVAIYFVFLFTYSAVS